MQFGNLNPEQIALVSRKATELHLPKEAYYLEAGQVARQFGFLIEGVIRVCY